MKAIEYIIKELSQLVQLIPSLKVRYEVDELFNNHFIEILPASNFYNETRYIQHERQITLDFIKLFPNESITFLTEGDLYEVKNPIFEEKGSMYDLNKLGYDNNMANIDFEIPTKFEQRIVLSNNLNINISYGQTLNMLVMAEILITDNMAGETSFALAA